MASYTKLWQGILPAVPRLSRCQVSKELFNFVRADMNTAPEAPADNLAENTVLNVKRREMFCFWGVHHTSSMQACQIFSFFFLGGFFFFYICQTPCLTLHLHRLKNVTRVSFAVGVSGSRKRVKCHFFGCGEILRTGNLTGSGETDKDELCSDESGNHKCVINNTGNNVINNTHRYLFFSLPLCRFTLPSPAFSTTCIVCGDSLIRQSRWMWLHRCLTQFRDSKDCSTLSGQRNIKQKWWDNSLTFFHISSCRTGLFQLQHSRPPESAGKMHMNAAHDEKKRINKNAWANIIVNFALHCTATKSMSSPSATAVHLSSETTEQSGGKCPSCFALCSPVQI